MGGEKFDSTHPEGYLFGENTDLNFLGTRPVAVRILRSWSFYLYLFQLMETIHFLTVKISSERKYDDMGANVLTCRNYVGSINWSYVTFQHV